MLSWPIEFHADFADEFGDYSLAIREAIAATLRLLEERGPALGRPHGDTLKGSKFANMKELRLSADDGEWRVAYAFDPSRRAILLVAGDKSGGSEQRFYRQLIRKADARFGEYLRSREGLMK